MTRRKLIKEHGPHWRVFIVDYDREGGERPCEDCGQKSICRESGDPDVAVCADCASWRLGVSEGKREVRENIAAYERREARIRNATGDPLASLTNPREGG